MPENKSMGLLDWGLLLFLSFLWGGSFFFSKVALEQLPPFTVVLVRVAVASSGLFIYLRAIRHKIPKTANVWLAFFGMGVLNNLVPFSLIFWAQTEIASGLASILNATTPIFSILIAHFLTTDEKLTPRKLAGVILGFTGVIVLVAGNTLPSQTPPLLALLACLSAAFSYGCAGIFGRRFRRMGITPATGAFGQTAATTIMMVPIVIMVDQPWHLATPDGATLAALLALGLLSTALAYIIFFHILSVSGAVNSSLVTLLIPVSAILLGNAFLGERLATNQFAGMSLIALGLLAIDGRIFRLISLRKVA